jgi:hypothetical protein
VSIPTLIVAGESRRGDVLYTERRNLPIHRRRLGTLGELARGRVLFELFRNPPTLLELKSCVLKAVDLTAQEARCARRAKRPPSSVGATMLCVITSSLSAEYAVLAGAAPMSGDRTGCARDGWEAQKGGSSVADRVGRPLLDGGTVGPAAGDEDV